MNQQFRPMLATAATVTATVLFVCRSVAASETQRVAHHPHGDDEHEQLVGQDGRGEARPSRKSIVRGASSDSTHRHPEGDEPQREVHSRRKSAGRSGHARPMRGKSARLMLRGTTLK